MILASILLIVIILIIALLLLFLFYILFPSIHNQNKVCEDPVVSNREKEYIKPYLDGSARFEYRYKSNGILFKKEFSFKGKVFKIRYYDDKGNFIRHMGSGKFYRKEGFISPVSQNERHLNVIKEIRKEFKTNFLTQGLFEKLFPRTYRSVVVFANQKTILNDKNAPDDIRKIVIRADQLVSHIKKIEEEDDIYKSSEKEMHELLDSFIKCSKPNKSDYAKKYEELLAEYESQGGCRKETSLGAPVEPKVEILRAEERASERVCPKCGKQLVLRTAQKGENAGKHFWGCSGFPKCWYKELVAKS